MIENKVLKLLKASKLPNGVEFPINQEIEVVEKVIYVGGFPLPPNMQGTMTSWIENNPSLFKDVTRKWK